MRNIGVIVVLLGALALIVPAFANFQSNTTLGTGFVLMIAGAVLHTVFYKRSIDSITKK